MRVPLLVKGKDATYGVEPVEDSFYVLTDEGAPKKRVFKVDPEKPERAHWVEVVKEDPRRRSRRPASSAGSSSCRT